MEGPGEARPPFLSGRHRPGPNGKVRIRRAGEQAFITFKGPRQDTARAEYEYPIPVDDAEELLRLFCEKPLVEKTRHEVHGEGSGKSTSKLVTSVWCGRGRARQRRRDTSSSSWVGREVTTDPHYANTAIAARLEGHSATHD